MFSFHLKVTMWHISVSLDQSNIVCEYEVNMSTNEKVITEKQNFNTIFLKNIVEYQGHLKVTMLRVGKVNPLTNDNVIRGKWNF